MAVVMTFVKGNADTLAIRLGTSRPGDTRIGGMAKKNQFAMREELVMVAIIGGMLAMANRWETFAKVLPPFIPFALAGACAGAIAGRIIRADRIHAIIGAALGLLAGAIARSRPT